MVDEAKYDIVKTYGNVEIRRYRRLVVARVSGYGDDGFSLLFNYITGDNRTRRRVAMTAPVVSQKIEMTAPVLSERGSIAFVMPDGFTMDNTPVPNDARVKILEIPERHVAALRFSGRSTTKAFERKGDELMKALEKNGIAVSGTVFAMRYNSPFTLPFMRRNEVGVEVTFKG